MADVSEAPAAPLFRTNKRRKIYRKRDDHEDPENAPELAASAHESSVAEVALTSSAKEDGEAVTSSASMAEILRRRKLGKPRRAGIEFSSSEQRSASHTPQMDTVAAAEPELTAHELAASRFTKQTGQVADTQDKHMMAYIDSKLAELRSDAGDQQVDGSGMQDFTARRPGAGAKPPSERQAAGLGKLQEVDLGPSATLRNIERTEAAKKRLVTGEPAEEEYQGRPGRWRRRRRRNSEDVKRDQLVEEVMRESRLEIYDEPEAAQMNDDQAADDRLAEKFKQEFLDAIRNNHIRRSAPTHPAANKGKDDKPRGPKLGGSRSARAAMKAMEEATGKRKKKK